MNLETTIKKKNYKLSEFRPRKANLILSAHVS